MPSRHHAITSSCHHAITPSVSRHIGHPLGRSASTHSPILLQYAFHDSPSFISLLNLYFDVVDDVDVVSVSGVLLLCLCFLASGADGEGAERLRDVGEEESGVESGLGARLGRAAHMLGMIHHERWMNGMSGYKRYAAA